MKLLINLVVIFWTVLAAEAGVTDASVHTLKGAVVTPDGTLVPEFTVVAKPIADRPELAQRRRFKNGLFKLDGLEKTRYEIQVSSPRYVGTKMDIEFPENTSVTDYRIFVLHTMRNEPRTPLGDSAFTVSADTLARPINEKALRAYQRGIALHEQGKLDEALGAYGEAIRNQPGYVQPMADAGAIYVVLNRPDSALTFLRHALRYDPKNPIVQLNIGIALMAKRQFDEAKKVFEDVAQQVTHKSLPRYYLARAYFHQKQYDLAESTVREALAENPALFEGWALIVNMALEQKNMPAVYEGLAKLREVMNNEQFSQFVNDQIASLVN